MDNLKNFGNTRRSQAGCGALFLTKHTVSLDGETFDQNTERYSDWYGLLEGFLSTWHLRLCLLLCLLISLSCCNFAVTTLLHSIAQMTGRMSSFLSERWNSQQMVSKICLFSSNLIGSPVIQSLPNLLYSLTINRNLRRHAIIYIEDYQRDTVTRLNGFTLWCPMNFVKTGPKN